MSVRRFSVKPVLRPFIEFLWAIESSGTFQILPDGRPEFLINYYREGQETLGAKVHFAGQFLEKVSLDSTLRFGLLGAHLSPLGGYYLLRENMSQVTGQVLGLRDWNNSSVSELENRISHCKTLTERLAIFSFLEDRLRTCQIDSAVQAALDQMAEPSRALPTNRLALELNLSERQLERRFKSLVGIGLKSYSSIVRFQAALTEIRTHPTRPLTQIAMDSGYFDQAHFIRDFKKYSGTTPGQYRARLQKASDFFI